MLPYLAEPKRQILVALSVVRNAVPAHGWRTPAAAPPLTHLLQLGLVQTDGADSLEMPIIYRQMIYRTLPEERRRELYLQAAALRSANGANTAAIYHLIQAGRFEDALAVWRDRQIQEIAQRQAAAALFLGQFETALGHVEQAISAYNQVGKLNAVAGCYITQAVTHNQAGDHQAALQAVQRAERLLCERGEITPWQQALLAQARAEAHLGLTEWGPAEEATRSTIAIEEMSLLPDAYRVYRELCAQQERWDEASEYLHQALACAQQNQDQLLTAYAWRALAHFFAHQRQFTSVTEALQHALQIFELLNLPP